MVESLTISISLASKFDLDVATCVNGSLPFLANIPYEQNATSGPPSNCMYRVNKPIFLFVIGSTFKMPVDVLGNIVGLEVLP